MFFLQSTERSGLVLSDWKKLWWPLVETHRYQVIRGQLIREYKHLETISLPRYGPQENIPEYVSTRAFSGCGENKAFAFCTLIRVN